MVELIGEWRRDWEGRRWSFDGRWRGDASFGMRAPGLLSMTTHGPMTLVIPQVDHRKGVRGHDVTGNFDAQLEFRLEIAVPGLSVDGGGQIQNTLEGQVRGDELFVTVEETASSVTLDFGLAGLVGGRAQGEYADGRRTVRGWMAAPLGASSFSAGPGNTGVALEIYDPWCRCIRADRRRSAGIDQRPARLRVAMHAAPWMPANVDFQGRIDRAFARYVAVLLEERERAFAQAATSRERMDTAKETQRLLLTANAVGTREKVTPAVITGAGLTPQTAGSLYDRWFARWEENGAAHWQARANAAAAKIDAHIVALRERYEFHLRVIEHAQTAVISSELIEARQLYAPGERIEGVYWDWMNREVERRRAEIAACDDLQCRQRAYARAAEHIQREQDMASGLGASTVARLRALELEFLRGAGVT